MFTYSHFLTTAWVADRLRRFRPIQVPAFVLGSVLPDLPLIAWTFWYFSYRPSLGPVSGNPFGALYDDFFFRDPLWIVSHNLFHAPLLIVVGILIGRHLTVGGSRAGFAMMWFWIGCGLHSVADVITHHNDGPLLLFPLDWQWRFVSPISYWHPAYYGNIVGLVESTLNLLIIGYFAVLAAAALWRGVRGRAPGWEED